MAIVRGTAGITVHRKRNELSEAVRRQERGVREGRISRVRDSWRYIRRQRSAGGNEDGGAVSPGIGTGRIHDAETAIDGHGACRWDGREFVEQFAEWARDERAGTGRACGTSTGRQGFWRRL